MSISGPAVHSLSLVALWAIHLRSRRLREQASRPRRMSAAGETFRGGARVIQLTSRGRGGQI